ncbi:30S ribosomal protein S7 [Patescibacteria group bacterium]|nr:30S ribosomal protein S7 [Patescibacteria group bacterium]
MARDPRRTTKRIPAPDKKYNSVVVSKFINKIMLDGKKSVAEGLMYSALEIVAEKSKKDPLPVFEAALKNVSPTVQVKSRRVGGSNYQIPIEVKGDKRNHFGMVWLRDAARSRAGMSFDQALALEIIDAANSTGSAFKKKEDTHKMAEANKAFAHFARF